MVTVFAPTSSGIDALHCAVPDAVPAEPVFVLHTTDATATLSDAVPLKIIDAADVETAVAEGELIVNVGGVVSPDFGAPGVPGGFTGGVTGGAPVDCCRAIVKDCEVCVALSDAVIVTVFDPSESGMAAMVHDGDPWARPLWPWSVDQATETAPDPPEVVPEIPMLAPVVLDAGGFTLSANAAGVGLVGGAGAVESCAA